MTPFPAGPQAGGPGYTGAPSFPQAGAPFTAYPQQGFTTYPQYAGYPQYPPDYTGYPQVDTSSEICDSQFVISIDNSGPEKKSVAWKLNCVVFERMHKRVFDFKRVKEELGSGRSNPIPSRSPSHASPCSRAPNLYSPYGGPQFPVQAYGPGSIANPATGLYPYSGFTQPLQGGPGYASPQAYTGVQGPPLMQYGSPAGVTPITSMAQQYPGTMTIPTASPSPGVAPTIATAGVGGPGPTQQFAVATPTQQQFSTGGVPEQPSG
ncbi:hypothetical protein AXG93_4804s1040 [Marchantia polymorpha subsp. ruderalis]|uniref:Uncharacterized protein n=1 Tax=Marchantia polymorpha subsp. ruderalis TaxID=1480154 RepID=A0A176VM26_MARPO|nr:hypothetical protein AXG93_4804s1040 [Marchantia polymorpha subsp. ruderalis]